MAACLMVLEKIYRTLMIKNKSKSKMKNTGKIKINKNQKIKKAKMSV
jgi:hypothetical protein